jgi:hypothetical protein
MKEFAGNIRKIIPEGSPLPKGTQELLDLPTTTQANEALNKYLASKTFYYNDGSVIEGVGNARIQSFQVDKDGKIPILYDTALAKDQETKTLFKNVTDNLVKQAEANAVPTKAIAVGQKADIGTVTRATATPKRSAMGARVSYSPAMETVGDNIEKVMGRSKATRGLLGAATEASAAVAGGVGQSNALRMAGAAASILRRRVI